MVQVEVKEKSTGTFQVGLGFSNVESFIFTAQIAQQNFLGWGQSVSASAQLSGLRSFFQLSYFDPYFLDTNFIFSIDAYRTQLDYFGFVRDAFGGTASLGYYVIADEMSVNLGYTYENVNVQTGQPGHRQRRSPASTAAAPPAPCAPRGPGTSATTACSPRRAGCRSPRSRPRPPSSTPPTADKQYNFNRYTAYQRVYFPLPLGAVFKMNLQVGYVQEHFPGDADRQLPISELYFLGGINTIRGYPLRQVAPSAAGGLLGQRPTPSVQSLRVGGNKQLIFNAELEIPLLEKVGIRGVLFFDAGNSFGRNANFFEIPKGDALEPLKLPLGLLYSVGFGVRWFSPIGPLRFEWGIPLTRAPGRSADPVRVHHRQLVLVRSISAAATTPSTVNTMPALISTVSRLNFERAEGRGRLGSTCGSGDRGGLEHAAKPGPARTHHRALFRAHAPTSSKRRMVCPTSTTSPVLSAVCLLQQQAVDVDAVHRRGDELQRVARGPAAPRARAAGSPPDPECGSPRRRPGR